MSRFIKSVLDARIKRLNDIRDSAMKRKEIAEENAKRRASTHHNSDSTIIRQMGFPPPAAGRFGDIFGNDEFGGTTNFEDFLFDNSFVMYLKPIETVFDWNTLTMNPAFDKSSEIISEFNKYLRNLTNLVVPTSGGPAFPSYSIDDKGLIEIMLRERPEFSESFSNELENSFLQDLGESAMSQKSSTMAAHMRTMSRDIRGISDTLSESAGNMVSNWANEVSGLLGSLGHNKLSGAVSTGGEVLSHATKIAGAVASGRKVSFPKVWKNSGMERTYSFGIRLYNPKPDDDAATHKYIIAPLAALLLFVVPRGSVGDSATMTYTMPFFCDLNVPGLTHLYMGVFTSIQIMKVGEYMISNAQRVTYMDINFTVEDLNMLFVALNEETGDLPYSINRFLENMLEKKNRAWMSIPADVPVEPIEPDNDEVVDVVYETEEEWLEAFLLKLEKEQLLNKIVYDEEEKKKLSFDLKKLSNMLEETITSVSQIPQNILESFRLSEPNSAFGKLFVSINNRIVDRAQEAVGAKVDNYMSQSEMMAFKENVSKVGYADRIIADSIFSSAENKMGK